MTTDVAASTGFELLPNALANDVRASLVSALNFGAIFPTGNDPLLIFRGALTSAIRDIEKHPRGELLQRFLAKGPYWAGGEIPAGEAQTCMSDDEAAEAVTFIYSYLVNAFQGALAELLAAGACAGLIRDLAARDEIPQNCRLYAGDSVAVRREVGPGWAKAADFHLLKDDEQSGGSRRIIVAGVAEVKSYRLSRRRLMAQLDSHLVAATRGLRVQDTVCEASEIEIGYGKGRSALRIAVVPGSWGLSRAFRLIETGDRNVLRTDQGNPRHASDEIEELGRSAWRITLRWSKEALAAAAYEVTFWYMKKVGEVIYAAGVPKDWGAMTAAEAGRNAAKMMLYYAILRARTWHQEQRAIALYNAYGFGYALGTSFKNPKGSREMLWFEDLEEILARGETKHGCRLVP